MKGLLYRMLDEALNVDAADPDTGLGLARIVASGTVVLAVGVGIVVRGYVLAGFRWPSERGEPSR